MLLPIDYVGETTRVKNVNKDTEQTDQPIPKKSFSKKQIIIAAIALVVVVSVGVTWMMLGKKQVTVTAEPYPASPVAEITITKDGFIPDTITVAPDTIVTWTNQDDADHQVAADPYPANDSFGLGNGEVIPKNGKFSYVFDEVGTFTYHDELNPLKLNGTVEVKQQ